MEKEPLPEEQRKQVEEWATEIRIDVDEPGVKELLGKEWLTRREAATLLWITPNALREPIKNVYIISRTRKRDKRDLVDVKLYSLLKWARGRDPASRFVDDAKRRRQGMSHEDRERELVREEIEDDDQ